jgi:pyruvate kinase
MRMQTRTKIVATLGPSSHTEEQISRLFEAGADVFRLNFSHGSHEDHAELYRVIGRLEQRYGRPIGVFADLQGPKLRLGTFAEGRIQLKADDRFRLDLFDEPGDAERAPLPHPEIFAALRPGTGLLLDDGKVRLEVVGCGADFADTRVVVGGMLSDHKGVNLPNVLLEVSPLTEKDRRDLAFALDLGIGMVALSFVQRPEDLIEARELIGDRAGLLAKLEKPSAIKHLYKIVDLADAVMVARGDLGVEMPPEEVPVLQKRIIRACRYAGKPVVVATQMLDSMIRSPTPTRAEASDVATAVYEGADAVMLSGETASGDYPVEAVKMMEDITESVERDPLYRTILDAVLVTPETTPSDAITAATRTVAETISAAVIVTFTTSGSTTLRATRERPSTPVLALTPKRTTARNLTLAWGVHSLQVGDFHHFDDMIGEAVRRAAEVGLVEPGDKLVLTAGMPLGVPGMTNVLRIVVVDASGSRPAV